ncbi:hypothetical protein [Pelagibaculum spongiae]|uniref:Uncharacterized protein n=1 Tax=Pelagibaculum spongiae TaxID=2080658 RepID=A0A2V1GXX9_9GAMM|nr:hypothetical protein [Pelagibaculum spongiae]PVZ66382.1 hypothetical protein DC094_16950 [Pelagibaculum spongiae]
MDFNSQSALLLLLIIAIGAIASISYFKQNANSQPKNLTISISLLLLFVPPFALIYLAFSQLSAQPERQNQQVDPSRSTIEMPAQQPVIEIKRAQLVLVK